MQFITQFYLLVWKNFTLHIRNPAVALGELLLPSLFAMILLLLKHFSDFTYKKAMQYEAQPLFWNTIFPKMGYIPESPAAKNITEWVLTAQLENLKGYALRYPEKISNADFNVLSKQVEAIGFESVGDAFTYFKTRTSLIHYFVEFVGINKTTVWLPKSINVIIHPYRKALNMWCTDKIHMFEFTMGPRVGLALDSEFAYIQSLVSKGILAHWLRMENKDPNEANFPLYSKRLPEAGYYEDGMYFTIRAQLSLFMVLGFMMSVFVDTKNIVSEKELRIKETMKLMGMSLPAFWVSWFLTCFVALIPALAFYTIILHVDLTGKGPILQKSDPTVVLTVITCYCLALISYSFMISCLVQKGNDGAIAAGLIFLTEYVPYEIINQKYESLTKPSKFVSCLFFNIALGLSNYNLARREARGEGLQWNNYNKPIEKDDFCIRDSMTMLLVDTVIHLILTWYLDNVLPGDFGVPKPFYFFLTRSYWCGWYVQEEGNSNVMSPAVHNKFFEKEPENMKIGVEILELRKEFGDKVSVNDLTMNMYEGQITVLLGHNGAGKTTTMSMLTGFIPPTKGTAVINGYDIRKNIAGVRKSLGLCPQHDILFDGLTCREHLWFFTQMKGYQSKVLNQEIKDMLKEIGLEHKKNVVVKKMSGGEKRSLSVGIALMGGSKVIFLDEPSSGMDPATRRHTWDVLQKNRKERTMILSTHYMDEADALGDRIAIMADGHVQCCGTSIFLKKLYGTGYHLVIVKENKCNTDTLTKFIQTFVPNAQVESVVSMEISYLLPETDCDKFSALFRHLKAKKKDLMILSFGTTATTMEEVFLKSEEVVKNDVSIPVESIEKSVGSFNSKSSDEENILDFNSGFKVATGARLKLSQLTALLMKRFIVARRHLMATILTYCIPGSMLLLYIMFEFSIIATERKVDPLLKFDIDIYGRSSVIVSYDNVSDLIAEIYGKNIKNSRLIDLKKVGYDDVDEYFKTELKDSMEVELQKKFVVGAQFLYNPGFHSLAAIALFNGKPYHSLFVSVDLVMKTMVSHLLDDSYNITVGILPIPFKGESELEFSMFESFRSGFFAGMFTGIGMAMLSASVVHFILRERHNGVKHMQAIFGVSMLMYWIPTFLWDAIGFVIPILLLFIIFFIFDLQAFLSGNNWILVIIIFCVFIWSILPITYALQFCFSSPSSGLAGVLILNLLSVLFSDIMVFEFGKPTSENTHVAKILNYIFTVFFPCFNLSQCFSFILMNHKAQVECEPYQDDCEKGIPSLCCINFPDICYSLNPHGKCFKWTDNVLEMDRDLGIGSYLVLMVAQGCFGCLAVFFIEYGLITRLYFYMCTKDEVQDTDSDGPDEEDDVVTEKQRILNTPIEELSKNDSLILVDLHKKYRDLIAVDHISVGIPEKECFGLLGQSGAGKTTIFRMLTGETAVTGGNAFIKGYNIRTNLRIVQSNLGYCPQFDAHIEELTGIDTLTMYARLRGIPERKIHSVVSNLINVVLLKPHAERACGTYSGGNRRKLSLAMALVGDPQYILLDEPSTGMDPKARRQMWTILSKIRACGRTLILSSHSMEECDALCTRLAIMLRGRFTCLGSPQYLKNKFGQGYTLIIKMGTLSMGEAAPTEPVVEHIQSIFTDTTVFDDHQGYVHLQISDPFVEVADVFSLMEDCKPKYNVEYYSVHETSLEQIFLTFTKIQALDDEERVESCLFLRAGFFNENLCY